ncbi:MAG: molybdate ABC transporter substrate-binding protein [Pseudomonadota bacterium]
MSRHTLLFALVLWIGALATGPSRADGVVTVFAASSLSDVLADIERAFEQDTGISVRLSLAASSTLARQVERGAPADIYISANNEWVQYLIDKGAARNETTFDLAKNTLVLITPSSRDPAQLTGLAAFDFATWFGSQDRLAIADPDHVPAGRYARQALLTLERWEAVSERLAIAQNVRAALALVEREETPLGIVYRTDAEASNRVRVVAAIPPETHDPIRYRATRLGEEPSIAARTFWTYLQGPRASAHFLKHGFSPIPQ